MSRSRRSGLRLALLVGGALLCGPLTAASREPLIQVLPDELVPGHQQLRACPCHFDLGKHIDGEDILVIDYRGDGQAAYAMIDGALLRLPNASPFHYTCEPGKTVKGTWSTAGTRLSVVLVTERPGEESCWFHGEMNVVKGNRRETRKIVGACGC